MSDDNPTFKDWLTAYIIVGVAICLRPFWRLWNWYKDRRGR